MYSGPSKAAEAIVAVLVPPASREEVLGDLHERYSSPSQYGFDALRTIPLVIFSRIRRTTDPLVLPMQAFVLYLSFLIAAWLQDGAFLHGQAGLMRLAIPAAIVMLGLILDDAYAKPGQRSPLKLIRGPVLGFALALAAQGVFRIADPNLAIPAWIAFYGCAISLPLSSALRILFPPVTSQLQSAKVPADWLKQSARSIGSPETTIRIVKVVAGIFAVVIAGLWIADRAALPKPRTVLVLLLVLLAYQIGKRG